MRSPVLDYAPKSKRPASVWLILTGAAIVSIVAWNMIVPQYTYARNRSGPSPWGTLNYLRNEISRYASDHDGKLPAAGSLWMQLRNATNRAGAVGPNGPSPDFPYGPYGPYNQAWSAGKDPVNQRGTNRSEVGTTASSRIGWVYTVEGNHFQFHAVNNAGDGILDD